MSAMASQFTGVSIVFSTVCSVKKTSKLRVTGLWSGERWIPAQRASIAENVSIWWRHRATRRTVGECLFWVRVFRSKYFIWNRTKTWMVTRHCYRNVVISTKLPPFAAMRVIKLTTDNTQCSHCRLANVVILFPFRGYGSYVTVTICRSQQEWFSDFVIR